MAAVGIVLGLVGAAAVARATRVDPNETLKAG
jgi:hypothetical protein